MIEKIRRWTGSFEGWACDFWYKVAVLFSAFL